MAKKKSQPNQPKKQDGNTIHIELGIHKVRHPIKPSQRFRSRAKEETKGHTRKHKHKQRHSDA